MGFHAFTVFIFFAVLSVTYFSYVTYKSAKHLDKKHTSVPLLLDLLKVERGCLTRIFGLMGGCSPHSCSLPLALVSFVPASIANQSNPKQS